jgi:hypothetical protein
MPFTDCPSRGLSADKPAASTASDGGQPQAQGPAQGLGPPWSASTGQPASKRATASDAGTSAASKSRRKHPEQSAPSATGGEAGTTQRELEKARYLAANPTLLDAEERWAVYEQLILNKYGGASLEDAWHRRDRHHERV